MIKLLKNLKIDSWKNIVYYHNMFLVISIHFKSTTQQAQ